MEFTGISSLLTQPINFTIICFGIFTFALNLFCWYQAYKRCSAIRNDMMEISKGNVPKNSEHKLPMQATMHWATSGQYNDHLKKIIAGIRCIENIHQKDMDDGNKENLWRNLYSGFVEILPLCGIGGTLYAIFKQTIVQGNMDVTDIQANFGLAITSTLLALGFTAVNIIIEGGLLAPY